jgi:hypothetical protein
LIEGLGAVLIVLSIGLCWLNHLKPREVLATADQIQQEAQRLMQSERYLEGEQFLAELKESGIVIDPVTLEADLYRNFRINQHLVIKFAGTITPDQADIMKKMGGLPYSSLRDDQR